MRTYTVNIFDQTAYVFADLGITSGVFVPRSRPPGHEQRFPNEDRVATGHPLHDQHDGAPSFRPVRDDFEQRRQQHIPSALPGGLSFSDEAGGEFDTIHGLGHVFQKEKSLHGGRGRRRI